MLSRILLKSFSHYLWCDQSGCNQTWQESDRSRRLTSLIFPFCQFAGTIIVASSRRSHVSLDLQLSSKIFLLLPDISALICASCHVTLLSLPNQMTCTCSCSLFLTYILEATQQVRNPSFLTHTLASGHIIYTQSDPSPVFDFLSYSALSGSSSYHRFSA